MDSDAPRLWRAMRNRHQDVSMQMLAEILVLVASTDELLMKAPGSHTTQRVTMALSYHLHLLESTV